MISSTLKSKTMRHRFGRMLVFWFSLWLCADVALPAFSDELQTVQFHGIRPTDSQGREGLRNPERGFRLETRIADGKEPHWLGDAQKYREHGITLA